MRQKLLPKVHLRQRLDGVLKKEDEEKQNMEEQENQEP
jgi:hypothetical protein